MSLVVMDSLGEGATNKGDGVPTISGKSRSSFLGVTFLFHMVEGYSFYKIIPFLLDP